MDASKLQMTGIRFPSLVIPGGNVLIRLFGAREDTVLIPSTCLRQSEMWSKWLSGKWNTDPNTANSKIVINEPDTNQEKVIERFILAGIKDDSAFLLQGTVRSARSPLEC